jgi:hypothetical protein
VDGSDAIREWRTHFALSVPIERAEDLAIALSRANSIAREVLGEDASLIIACELDQPESVRRDVLNVGAMRLATTPAVWTRSLRDHLVDPDRAVFWVAEVQWRPGRLDSILRQILSDRWGTLTIMSLATGDTVCPYEGGVDTFVGDEHKRNHLCAQFEPWLWSLRVSPGGGSQ